MTVVRYDTAPINKLEIDSQTGFLVAHNVPIARTGVFPYAGPDNTVHYEAKLPQEILSAGTIESADSKPITDDHPNGLINAQNASKFMKGFTASNAHKQGDTLRVDMTITNPELIKKVKNGKQELSIGFQTDIDKTPGIYQDSKYDMVQRNIQINHVAVVNRGRAGSTVRLGADAAMQIDDFKEERNDQMADEFESVRFGDQTIRADKADVDKLIKADADTDALKKENAQLKQQVADLQAQVKKLQSESQKGSDDSSKELDEAKAKADSLESENKKLQEKVDSIDDVVNAKVNLINSTKSYLGDSYEFKGKSSKDIKMDTIKAVHPDMKLDGKSDDYINAAFDMAIADKAEHAVGYTGNKRTDSADRNDEAIDIRNARYNLYNGGDK